MAPTVNGTVPGASSGVVSALAHEHLLALAQRCDDAVEHLDALRHRVVLLGGPQRTWSGPGSLAFAARIEAHERELGEGIETCREAARLVRWGGAALADHIAGLEASALAETPLNAVLGMLLGPGAVTAGPGLAAPAAGSGR